MDINTDAMADKANQIKDQATQFIHKVDTKKAMSFADIFMAKVFIFGKVVSTIFMFLCILVMVGSLLYWMFSGSSSLKVPSFSDVKEVVVNQDKTIDDDNKASNKEISDIRKKYGSDIDKLIDISGMKQERTFGVFMRKLSHLPKKYRSDYMDGVIDFVSDAKKYSKDKQFDGAEVIATYDEIFEEALNEVNTSKEEAKLKKAAALGTFGSALIGLVLFLIIPLLLQIEQNTRKE